MTKANYDKKQAIEISQERYELKENYDKKLALAIRPESFELKEILNCDKNMTDLDKEKYDKNIFEVMSVFKQTREELAHIKKGTKEFTVFMSDDSGVKKYDKVALSIKEKGCFIFDSVTGERLK